MSLAIVRPLLLLCALLLIPALIFAQEAVLTGTTTDATGTVLPGVTVQATHESIGNTFDYKITAQLGGFAAVTRQCVELLVGQKNQKVKKKQPA